MAKTIKAMKRIAEIKQRRERAFMNARHALLDHDELVLPQLLIHPIKYQAHSSLFAD
jgi:hypothetical protein